MKKRSPDNVAETGRSRKFVFDPSLVEGIEEVSEDSSINVAKFEIGSLVSYKRWENGRSAVVPGVVLEVSSTQMPGHTLFHYFCFCESLEFQTQWIFEDFLESYDTTF